MAVFTLRYTQDLYVVSKSDNLAELKPVWSDHLMHIINEHGHVVWQNNKSQRYGDVGVDK